MRLMRKRLDCFIFRNAKTEKDNEGVTSRAWGDPVLLPGVMWNGGGRVQEEKYGARLPMVRNIMLAKKYKEETENGKVFYRIDECTLSVGDGLCYATDEEPDYIIRAIYPYNHLSLELEHV